MKTAMILGAAGGIGSAVANRAIETGFQAIQISRNGTSSKEFDVQSLSADFGLSHELERMAFEAAGVSDPVDLWVYAVGDIFSSKVEKTKKTDWMRIMGANFFGAHYAVQASLPLLKEDAHLFFIGAYVDRLIFPGMAAYASSKAALETYTAVLAKELPKMKISLVRPAAVDTDFWDKVPFKKPSNAISAEQAAEKIFNAYDQGLTGLIDL